MGLVISATTFSKGKFINPNSVRVVVKTALDKVAKDIKADYKATMRTWKKQKVDPVLANQGEEARLIYVNSKVFGFVDWGTRPHIITPRTARRLAFRSGFTPKTTPGVIGSGPGGSFGAYVYAKRVSHPGNKPRLFTKAIAEKRKNDLQREIDKGLASL